MSGSWQSELWRLLWVLAAGALIGVINGHLAATVAIALVLHAVYHLRQVYRLDRWLTKGAKKGAVPECSGVWEHIVSYIYQTQQSSRKRKSRLVSMLSRFNKSTEALPDAAVVLRSNGEIDWANSAAGNVLGVRNPQDIGQRIDNLMRSPDFRDYLAAAEFSSSLEIPSPVYESMMLSVRIIEYGDGLRLMLAHDITADNRLQQVRRDFVANVSHELKTPLTVILGYTESLRGDSDIPDYTDKGLSAIDQQAKRMSGIVDDLLTLSKLELDASVDTDEQEVDVAELVKSLQEEAALLGFATGHTLSSDIDSDLRIRADFRELRSAFANLIFNAVQHTPPKSHVEIAWQRVGGRPCLSVSDNGPGIPQQHVSRLTERFYRVDSGRSREVGGTGLGLAIVKHALEKNNGSLSVESTPYSGTTFWCTFTEE